MQATVLITAVTILMVIYYGAMVSKARRTYHLPAPAMTGHPVFERICRTHQNAVEQLVLFLPSLWMFAFYVSDLWAGLLGLVYVGARIVYGLGYAADPERRQIPFAVSMLVTLILLIGAVIGALTTL